MCVTNRSFTRDYHNRCRIPVNVYYVLWWRGDNSHYARCACALANGIISYIRALWCRRDILPHGGRKTANYTQEKGENFHVKQAQHQSPIKTVHTHHIHVYTK